MHAASTWLIWAVWPFSRLVHAWSAPLWYLWRPYIVYRSRVASRPAEPGTSGRRWRKIGVPSRPQVNPGTTTAVSTDADGQERSRLEIRGTSDMRELLDTYLLRRERESGH